ncbi:hypothetical protein ACHWQZ_G000091 [Mnemiopsis leidyi]
MNIVIIAFCIVTLGIAKEVDIMDFIENESELLKGFVFGQGWSWVNQNVEESAELNLKRSADENGNHAKLQ